MVANGTTPAGATRWRCNAGGKYCFSSTKPGTKERLKAGTKKARAPAPPVFKRNIPVGSKARFIITSAQNATPVHKDFWKTLLVAAKHLDAELIVIPIRYKNPTSIWSQKQDEQERWADEVQDYLYNQRKHLGPNLVLLGDVKAQPTASSPLTGFEGLTGGESSIIGHTKVQLRVIPTPTGKLPKILTTTGACTLANFTDTKAGKLGEFHHSLAACVVELDGKIFHLRQISASHKDGSFTDLDTVYTPTGVKKAPRALGLVMGDTHARFTDKTVKGATFSPGGIVDLLDPENLVWHDVLDGYAANPHHDGNPFIAFAKAEAGFGDVRKEVEDTIAFVGENTKGRKSIIVASNHDNFLSRWVQREDWKRNITNAKFYLETAQAMLNSCRMTEGGTVYGDPFKYWVGKLSRNPGIRCLDIDESFSLAGIECGMHGHYGPNGARGSIKNLSRLGSKVISGHGHTPGIEEGHFRTGTSTPLRLEYTNGPSSWLNSHVVVYASGKRSIITIIDGAWRLED